MTLWLWVVWSPQWKKRGNFCFGGLVLQGRDGHNRSSDPHVSAALLGRVGCPITGDPPPPPSGVLTPPCGSGGSAAAVLVWGVGSVGVVGGPKTLVLLFRGVDVAPTAHALVADTSSDTVPTPYIGLVIRKRGGWGSYILACHYGWWSG